MPPMNRGSSIDRPKSQPQMPSRLPRLITKPERSTSVPHLELLNTDTPRISKAAQTRPWRPGSVSPKHIQSETRLPNPKLAKFLDRNWKSMSILPSYPKAGPERQTTASTLTQERCSYVTQYTANSLPLVDNKSRASKIPVMISKSEKIQITSKVKCPKIVDHRNVHEANEDHLIEESVRESEAHDLIEDHTFRRNSGALDFDFPRLSSLAKNVVEGMKRIEDEKRHKAKILSRLESVNIDVATESNGCIKVHADKEFLQGSISKTIDHNDLGHNSVRCEVLCIKSDDRSADKMKIEVNGNIRRLSYLASKIALEFSLNQLMTKQLVGDVTSSSLSRFVKDDINLQQMPRVAEKAAEQNVSLHRSVVPIDSQSPFFPLRHALDDNHFKKTVDVLITEELNNDNGWHYYSTERAAKASNKTDKNISDNRDATDHRDKKLIYDVVEPLVDIMIDACLQASHDENKNREIEHEESPAITETNDPVDITAATTIVSPLAITETNDHIDSTAVTTVVSPLIQKPRKKDQRKKKIKEKKNETRVDDKIDRQLLESVAENPDGLSNSDALEMVIAIHNDDPEATKMLEELKLLTRLEEEQENKIIKSKDEECRLVSDLEKYRSKLANTIDKKKKIDEKLMQIYKVELNADTEYGVIEDYLLAENLAKTYHEKRNFEECSIAYLEHELQTRIEPKNIKPVKKLKEPKIKPRMTKNALRLQKEKGNKVRQDKIQKFEEEFKSRPKYKSDKKRAANFFKEPLDNNYRPKLPEMGEMQKVHQSKSREMQKSNTNKLVSVARKKVKSANTVPGQSIEKIKRDKSGQKEFQKNKQNLSEKEKAAKCIKSKSAENEPVSNSKEMKAKQFVGGMKTYQRHAIDENARVASNGDVHKYPITSGSNNTKTMPIKSLDSKKNEKGQIKRPKMEPDRLQQNAQRSNRNAGTFSTMTALTQGKHAKPSVASNITGYRNKKDRVHLPPVAKQNTQMKMKNTKRQSKFTNSEFVLNS